jgi:protein-S-isoprenylcysteine O-methyltransferase Ste14
MRSRAAALAGSALFLVIAPGTVAGLIPWLISGWRFGEDFGGSALLRAVGALLILAGLAGLVERFARFAWRGRGTPAPVAPTNKLIISGFYRFVRNPMYVSVIGVIVGEALLFGQMELLAYAALAWLCFHVFVIAYEEPAMRRQFPADYAVYSAAVRRWLPRLKPWQAGES